jgi:pyrroline-5-carboxylate reductase
MPLTQRIAFIGAGNMANALIRALVRSAVVPAAQIIAADPDTRRLAALQSELGIRVLGDNREAAREADIVVLATKPQTFPKLLPDLSEAVSDETLVISIAAGISTQVIEQALPAGVRVIRTMPNTPALVGAGATAIAAGTHATSEDLSAAQTLFQSVGTVVKLAEADIDAVTGLSGSGPAYVFAMVEALRDAGVDVGLSEETAAKLAAQTVYGAAKLLVESGESPEALREKVTSPGGTTAAGLQALGTAGFAEAVLAAIRAATARSLELGRPTDG